MPTPADLSLAVGDGARRMTYAELAGLGTEALSRAVDSLRELLIIANHRADRADRRAEAERARIDQLQTELSQAQRELIAERRRMIEILTGDRRPWWKRWFR